MAFVSNKFDTKKLLVMAKLLAKRKYEIVPNHKNYIIEAWVVKMISWENMELGVGKLLVLLN